MSTDSDADDRAAFARAIALFNDREFYACHDALEAMWHEAMEPHRTFYQGILQLAVGYYHLSNGNWRGAVVLLGEGLSRLDYYAPDYMGVNVDEAIALNSENLNQLHQLGPDRWSDFPSTQIPTIGLAASTETKDHQVSAANIEP